jgi:hypothetical protein
VAYTYKHGDRPLDGVSIQRAVGRGGFGEVYYARTDSGKEIALKYLRDNPEIELRGVAQVMNLKSPHLITIYDVRRNATQDAFVVMEYVSGPSLHELLTAEPKGLGPQKAAFFLNGIAKGLSYLHDRGIVHRDLKPGNIFYDEGYVKIGDYGLSKHMSVSRHSGQTASVGTVHYMAPEIGSGSYSKAIDIYALGVILYEMLTGKLPFTGSSMAEILMRHLQDRPDMAGIPEPFATVISRALQKNPTDRYQDVNEMVDAVLASHEISAGITSFDPRSLSNIPRVPLADDAARTVTTPHLPPPLPSMDARAAAAKGLREMGRRIAGVAASPGGLPPIPPIPPLPGERGDRHAQRVQTWRQQVDPDAMPYAQISETYPHGRGNAAWAFAFAAVLLASSGLLGAMVRGEPEAVIGFGLMLLGGTVGTLLAHMKILASMQPRNAVVDRAVGASVAFACMLPGYAVAKEAGVGGAIVPLTAALIICNWGSRIASGRTGIVNGASAISPAIVGLIFGGSIGDRDHAWAAAGLCAALAFLVQMAAGFWRKRSPASAAIPTGPQPSGASSADDDPDRKWLASMVDTAVKVADRGYSHAMTAVSGIGADIETYANGGFGGRSPAILPASESAAVPMPAPWKVWWRTLLALTVAGSVGFFVAAGNVSGADDQAGTLFGGLAGVAMLPFLIAKVSQSTLRPLWAGTFRWFLASLGLCLTAGMIAILAFQDLHGEEIAASVFGLLAGLFLAGVFLSVQISSPSQALSARTQPVPPPAAPAETAPVRLAEPSFVGRTANAGLSLFGKVLLVAGLASAIFGHAKLIEATGPNGQRMSVGAGQFYATDGGRNTFEARIPPAVFFAPIAIGTLFLLLARRRDGGLHIFRGLVAAGCGLAAAGLALGPAAPVLQQMFEQGGDPERLLRTAPSTAMTVLALASLALIFWPKRPPNTIVI